MVETPPTPSSLSIEAFQQVQLVVGEVRGAERVPGTDRLLKLTVDVGESSPRTLVAGIAQSY